jgi:hypothetical protein
MARQLIDQVERWRAARIEDQLRADLRLLEELDRYVRARNPNDYKGFEKF